MKTMIERKLGEEFEYEGVKLRVDERDNIDCMKLWK